MNIMNPATGNRCKRWAAMLLVLAGGLGLPSASAQRAAATAGTGEEAVTIEPTTPATAILMVGGKTAKIKLVGTAEDRIAYRDLQGGKTKLLPRQSVEECYIELDLKFNELDALVVKRDWMRAAAMILGAVKPLLPYVDVPNNNISGLVLDCGEYIMRSAAADWRVADTEEAEAKVRKKYEAAYAILKHASKATWTSDGIVARVKSIKCLLEMDKPKTAAYYFEKIDAPFPGDAAYGAYWLVKAEMDVRKNQFRSAMDATVKSLCFENKDIDTFPDALLVSARCYEELQEWYRARDVYYEVAKIFPNTDWADVAVRRLEFIMEQELTAEEEKRPIENVFFSFTEDMNDLVEELLADYRAGRTGGDYSEYVEEGGEEFGERDLDEEAGESEFLD